jgi:hypothetical protein
MSQLLTSLDEINVESRILHGALEESADDDAPLLSQHSRNTGPEAGVPSQLRSAADMPIPEFWL